MPAGRPRKTKEESTLSGMTKIKPDRYKDRPITSEVGFSTVTEIDCPPKYSAQTKKAWECIIPDLLSIKVLSQEDLPALNMLFDAYELYIRYYKKEIEIEKKTDFENITCIKKLRMINSLKKSALEDFIKLASRFGITPVERTRLIIPEEEASNEDPLDILIQGR